VTSNYKIAGLLIAAGSSKRMGKPKQLLPWRNTTLLEHAIKQLKASKIHKLFVVLGANFNLISSKINSEGIHIIKNPNWQKGMGTSIASGISEIDSGDYDAVLIALGDQPFQDSFHYNSLIEKYLEKKNIVATALEEKAIVPAVFPEQYFEQLKNLKGDAGARNILADNKRSSVLVPSNGKDIDIDTPEDYERWHK
jgi:molybdenum cofactor cytidylyltransferase